MAKARYFTGVLKDETDVRIFYKHSKNGTFIIILIV